MINSVVMQNIDLEKQPVVWREYCWKYCWKEAQHVLLYYTAELMFKLFVNCQQTVQNLSYMIILTFCHSAKNKLDSPVIRVSTVDYLRLAFLVKTISGSKESTRPLVFRSTERARTSDFYWHVRPARRVINKWLHEILKFFTGQWVW